MTVPGTDPAGHALTQEDPTAQVVSSTPAVASEDPSAAEGRIKDEFEEKLTKAGRENKRLYDAMLAQHGRMATLETQLASLGQAFSQRQAAEYDAYLKTLPADQRNEKKIEMLEQRLRNQTAVQQPQPVAPVQTRSQESPEEYQARRSREILAEAKREFGVDVAEQDDGIDWSDEPSFRASVRAIAAQRKKFPQTVHANGVSAEKEGTDVAKKKESAAEDPRAMEERITSRLYEELGISRPNSPRAVGSVGDGKNVTTDDFQAINRSAINNPGQGMAGRIKALKEARANAEKALRK